MHQQSRKSDSQLHFIGIGGIGMSGIAEVFLTQGYRVTGSDLAESDTTRRLAELGAQIHLGHRAENVAGAHVVVISSAVKSDNPEVVEAKRLRVPVIPRAEMLGELMRGKTGIAVAGTHGKTTTTSMMSAVLLNAGLDPTLVIGGKVDAIGSNAKLGQGQFVVAEADESDGSFLQLPATYGIVTNIDNDHLDHFGSLSAVEDAFAAFVGKLPFYGLAAVCGEDAGVQRGLGQWTKPFVTYGWGPEWDYYATEVEAASGLGTSFVVFGRAPGQAHRRLGRATLRVPGRHNVLNALAVIAIALRLEIPFETIAEGLAQFGGVRRRFEIRGQDAGRRRAVVDDYGHHPTEIRATLSAARDFWPGRIITIFQPHRYSRTLHCRDGFRHAFGQSDVVILTDIYAAGEAPIEGVSGEALAAEIRASLRRPGQAPDEDARVHFAGGLDRAHAQALAVARDGDLVLCLGAGSITRLAGELVAAWITAPATAEADAYA